MEHASNERVLDEEVWRLFPSDEEQRVQECVRILENDVVVDVRRREVYSFGDHRTQFVEPAQLLEGNVMRPRFLPLILIGKQVFVQLLDNPTVELGVTSLTSARERIVLEVAGQHVCLPRVHIVKHLGKDFEENGPSASMEGVVRPLQKPEHCQWRVLAEDFAIDESRCKDT